ncbi:MAG: NUDIX domain-containing protein [Myxococcota bacterium]|nr:NUDIX domain-containing protein [Myxococcota bacterium]
MGISDHIRRLRERVGHELLELPSATALIFDERGRVLLVHHADTGRWTTPGGAIEPLETPADAVVREAWEETGLRVEPVRVLGVYGGPEFVVRYSNGDETSYLNVVFECRVTGGEARPDGEETLALRWVGPDELDGLGVSDGVRIVLRDAFSDRTRTHFAAPRWSP